jgi:hypothetical protein
VESFSPRCYGQGAGWLVQVLDFTAAARIFNSLASLARFLLLYRRPAGSQNFTVKEPHNVHTEKVSGQLAKDHQKAKVASTAKPIAKGEKNTSLMAIGSQHVSMRRK